MKSMSGVLAVLLALALVGCGGSQTQEEHGATTTDETHSQAASETAPAEGAPAEGSMVTLTGTVGCGHCNFGKTEHCSSAIQTAAGELYVIDGVGQDDELWKLREENAKQCEVSGTVTKGEDGLMHVTMSSYKVL